MSLVKVALNQLLLHQLQRVSLRSGKTLCKPSSIYATVTTRCPLHCRMCDHWKNKDVMRELDTAEWKHVLKELRDWIGPFHVNFGGGEPFIREDMIEILNYASSMGVSCGVVTNAFLINKHVSDQIVDTGIFNINISLDGIRPETHEFLRGTSGSFKKVIDAIKYLKESANAKGKSLRIIIKALITEYNLREMPGLAELALQENLTGVNFQPLIIWNKECHNLWVKDFEMLDNICDILIDMKKKKYPILNADHHIRWFKNYFRDPHRSFSKKEVCSVGYTNLFIRNRGEVDFCDLVGHIGNVRTHAVREIWHSEGAEKKRDEIRLCNRLCLQTCVVKRTLADKVNLFFNVIKHKV